MKKITVLILLLCLLFTACGNTQPAAQIAATTLPVYEFTTILCQGTPITASLLVTESVSCLHDYSLNVRQVKSAEAAELIVISGAGLEEFLEDILRNKQIIDASLGISLLSGESEHSHEEEHHEDHHHGEDPHIWLSPLNAKTMALNICDGLKKQYPQYEAEFSANLETLLAMLDALQAYGEDQLSDLSCREMITFHDGFSYFAEAFDLTILESVEEESGSEASARELIHLIEEVEHHNLPAIFTEIHGSVSAADILSRETGVKCRALDMAMSGESWFDAMYRNIDTVKEVLE